MSRAQGDGYRTHTDHELNAYKWRLRDKVEKLADHKENGTGPVKAGSLRRNRTAW
jgi:hypothetical protein